jgi:chemotaxis protein CheD
MSVPETMVRMGELAVSSAPHHVLVSLGLGSCIGLALLDRRMGVAGLAHIVLPEATGGELDNPRKFANLAVPELVAGMEDLGARRVRMEAALVGGASMFAVSAASLEVGQRNEAAVRELLGGLRIPVRAAATGGARGRTIRVDVATAGVTVREAGGRDEELVAGTPARALDLPARGGRETMACAGSAGACGAES